MINQPQGLPEPAPESGNKKIYIIVAVVAAIAIGVLLILALAIGIGLYTYDRNPPRPFERPNPTPNANTKPGTFPTTKPETANTTDILIKVFKKKDKIGEFSLQNVIPSHSEKAFQNSDGEAKGVYSNGSKTVSLLIAEYSDKSLAVTDFGRSIGKEKAQGAKILSNIKVANNVINAAYEKDGVKTVAFCNWFPDKAILCHQISSDDGSTLDTFRDALRPQNK